ncbi:MAG: EexN family lipoprotein [Gammaproteobacteria bacterium]|nr:EexN family lipoprotein [Gammaproteobacteria bacterium]
MLCSVALLGACAKEPPPRSVLQFIDNPMLLEAAMVRCNQDREQSKYDPECVNARQAAQIVQAREEASRAEELEARSAEKRRALRQAQEAAAEARRRALEAEERRKNKEYIEQFGEPPPVDSGEQNPLATGNLPVAVIPDPDDDAENAADETQAGEPSPTGNEDGTD